MEIDRRGKEKEIGFEEEHRGERVLSIGRDNVT